MRDWDVPGVAIARGVDIAYGVDLAPTELSDASSRERVPRLGDLALSLAEGAVGDPADVELLVPGEQELAPHASAGLRTRAARSLSRSHTRQRVRLGGMDGIPAGFNHVRLGPERAARANAALVTRKRRSSYASIP